jgi:hypothetical protein
MEVKRQLVLREREGRRIQRLDRKSLRPRVIYPVVPKKTFSQGHKIAHSLLPEPWAFSRLRSASANTRAIFSCVSGPPKCASGAKAGHTQYGGDNPGRCAFLRHEPEDLVASTKRLGAREQWTPGNLRLGSTKAFSFGNGPRRAHFYRAPQTERRSSQRGRGYG